MKKLKEAAKLEAQKEGFKEEETKKFRDIRSGNKKVSHSEPPSSVFI